MELVKAFAITASVLFSVGAVFAVSPNTRPAGIGIMASGATCAAVAFLLIFTQ